MTAGQLQEEQHLCSTGNEHVFSSFEPSLLLHTLLSSMMITKVHDGVELMP